MDLGKSLEGEFQIDEFTRRIYATDASAYKEMPMAVAKPKTTHDIQLLINFAATHGLSIIPRTAGTSLAGQVVGDGIVVDVSKYFTNILDLNTDEKWVKVQPGVIRDELNQYLNPHGFLFGPETSTANRAMIGGMIGNNSCGSNSVVYGSTRDHLIEVTAVLSDGSICTFKNLNKHEFQDKLNNSTGVERDIYQNIYSILSKEENRNSIDTHFPKKSIPRRNTGYAIDLLKDNSTFSESIEDFNFCKLIAGSEGTLAFILDAKITIDPLPPIHSGLICIHFNSVYDSLLGNLEALKFNPSACELMDHYILECTKGNAAQLENRFFVEGDPQALLVVELKRDTEAELLSGVEDLINVLKSKNLGYHFPLVTGPDTSKVWNLRKAGLGLLSNIPGDAKPVPVIEDTAVDVQDLPEYIKEFNESLVKHNLFCVHYAHAGSGELHLRPIINLKTEEGNRLFKTVAQEIAELVKKYKGSLSGEHGDGRLRGEFIPYMIGDYNYQLLKEIKKAWDPKNIFNPGKIVDTPSMNSNLRFYPGQKTPQFNTIFNFDKTEGILRAIELCNGSGDCRKTEKSGGTMCPSYMATRDERDTTRARANILREALSHPETTGGFNNQEGLEILDLCLSCKGCKGECPSNVDMAKLKAEYLYQHYKSHGPSFRTRLMANFSVLYKFAANIPAISNLFITSKISSSVIKSVAGIAKKRSLPPVAKQTLYTWFQKNNSQLQPKKPVKSVYFFADEFTNYSDVNGGSAAVRLLTALGYHVTLLQNEESGRTYISKGYLDEAKKVAIKNVKFYADKVSEQTPLIGTEPSTILSFRDEYLDLVDNDLRPTAVQLSKHCFTFEEFLAKEWQKGNIKKEQFNSEEKEVLIHGHCHQKAISSVSHTKNILSIPENYKVKVIPSGCCGMAGSFGYEKEHFEISQKVGELVLLPAVRNASDETIIAAAGTSCRHQIHDGANRHALHPAEILWNALIKN